jgi:hypothetical protein
MKRLARALTCLYPASWRERYGAEFQALLEQCPSRPAAVLNTAAGAVGAWLRWPALATSKSARLRGALTAVLWGGLAVLFAASGFVKAEVPATHSSVRAVGYAIVAVSLAAAALMASGAVLPALVIARRARRQHRTDVLRLISAPPIAGAVFVGFAVAVAVAAIASGPGHSRVTPALGHTIFYLIAALFLAAAIITGRAPSLALRRMDPGATVLRTSVPFGCSPSPRWRSLPG